MMIFPDGFTPRIPSDFLIPAFAPRLWPLPRPTMAFDAEPAVYWKINRTWLGHVSGAVDLLTQPDSWIGTDEEIFQTTQQAMKLIAQDYTMSEIFNLQQTGILIEKQGESGGVWSTLYDPRPYVLIKSPTAAYHNTVNAPADTAGLTLLSNVGNRANADSAVLYVVAGWNAPAATFRRNDASGNETLRIEHNLTGGVGVPDFMRATDTEGNKFSGINPFGNIVLRRYTSTLPAASAAHYGSLAMLGNGSTDNALWYCDYNAGTAEYYWRKGVGSQGIPGEIGHGIELLDPPLQEVLNPNEEPELVVDDALPSTTFIGLKLPRAAAFSKLPDIVGVPGVDVPAVAMAETTEGDYTIQFTVVAGENGGGEENPLVREVVPGLNETIDNYLMIFGDSGTPAGIVVPAYTTLTEVDGIGLWGVVGTGSPSPERITDKAGFSELPTYSTPGGKLMYGVKAVSDNGAFDYFGYDELPITFEVPVHLKFAQHRNASSIGGTGALRGRYRLSRGNFTWQKILDFTDQAYTDIVFDQDGSVSWVDGEGYVTDGGLWYARLSVGLEVSDPSVLVNIRTEQESIFTEPGSGWNNLDKVRVNVAGDIHDYNEAFSYPVSNKLRVVNLTLADNPLYTVLQFGADTRAVTGQTGVLTVRRLIIEGTGAEPGWIPL